MQLKNKIALVTGGSSGIGAEICALFAAEGATVAVVASSDVGKAQKVVDSILAAGGQAQAFACNVSDTGQIDTLVADVTSALGPIDILVNGAGVFYPTKLGETPEANYDDIVDTCLKGAFFMSNAVGPQMRDRGTGKIVNFGSAAGVQGRSAYIVYGAAKAAVMQMTKSLACALAPHGINVNCIAPGNTATPMNENVRTEDAYAATREIIAERALSGRPFSDPKEIAAMALFLVSDAAKPMHGETVIMDEGAGLGF